MINVIFDRLSATGLALQAVLSTRPLLTGEVNWSGRPLPQEAKLLLNANARSNKLAQLARLELCKVPVPYFTLSQPPPGAEGWLGRTIFHQQGRDLLTGLQGDKPDFWVSWTPVSEEWRIHVFKRSGGKACVIRSAKKLPKGENFHPWIRSHRLGWKLSYIGGAPEGVKAAARSAITALALDFGAVDVGVTDFGEPVVFEVNTCPGLDSGTLELYAQEIEKRFS